jgi:hypothetical protein
MNAAIITTPTPQNNIKMRDYPGCQSIPHVSPAFRPDARAEARAHMKKGIIWVDPGSAGVPPALLNNAAEMAALPVDLLVESVEGEGVGANGNGFCGAQA